MKAGSSFTLDITISAQGDPPLINYNPIPVSIILVEGGSKLFSMKLQFLQIQEQQQKHHSVTHSIKRRLSNQSSYGSRKFRI